ncbi:MAG: hypothetical protein WA733_04750 [Methylocystis sp.]
MTDFVGNKSPNSMLRRSIIFDRASPLHRRGLVMIVELSFDEARAIPKFCPLDVRSIGFEFIDEGKRLDLHRLGEIARMPSLSLLVDEPDNDI